MDEFTEQVIRVAYDECKQRRRRKRDPVTVDDLVARMGPVWVNYRDARIEEWANRLTAACGPENRSDLELETLVYLVDDKLLQWNVTWEVPLWEPTDDEDHAQLRREQITFVAWGIVCLWWLEMEGTEIAPILRYTRDEVAAWLEEKRRIESLVVEKRTKSGKVVEQFLLFAAQT